MELFHVRIPQTFQRNIEDSCWHTELLLTFPYYYDVIEGWNARRIFPVLGKIAITICWASHAKCSAVNPFFLLFPKWMRIKCASQFDLTYYLGMLHA